MGAMVFEIAWGSIRPPLGKRCWYQRLGKGRVNNFESYGGWGESPHVHQNFFRPCQILIRLSNSDTRFPCSFSINLSKKQELSVFNFRRNRTHITNLQYKYEELSVHCGVIAMSKLKSQIRNLKSDFLIQNVKV